MALRYSYRRGRTPLPVPSLAGQRFRPRPIIGVTLIGPVTSWSLDALLDTGADDTTFPEKLADLIGLDLLNAPARFLTGIGPAGYRVRYAEVRLRLTDGIEFREWPAWVGFTDAPLPVATLGYAGCLQFFTSTFYGDLEEVELVRNSHYPGS